MDSFWKQVEEDRKVAKEKASSIVDSLDLPLDHTYVWRIEDATGDTDKRQSKYGMTKSGLRSSLLNWDSKFRIRITPLINFKTIYED